MKFYRVEFYLVAKGKKNIINKYNTENEKKKNNHNNNCKVLQTISIKKKERNQSIQRKSRQTRKHQSKD